MLQLQITLFVKTKPDKALCEGEIYQILWGGAFWYLLAGLFCHFFVHYDILLAASVAEIWETPTVARMTLFMFQLSQTQRRLK